MKKELGGQRIGSGQKNEVELNYYERSTHDLSFILRTTMAPGTLVPFMSEVALPGDTFDIDLKAFVNALPTLGPLFAQFKLQLDVYTAPFRLYQGALHQNKLGIGLNMTQVKLPIIQLKAPKWNMDVQDSIQDIDNSQINPSCILNYLGIRGIGIGRQVAGDTLRDFNAIPTTLS